MGTHHTTPSPSFSGLNIVGEDARQNAAEETEEPVRVIGWDLETARLTPTVQSVEPRPMHIEHGCADLRSVRSLMAPEIGHWAATPDANWVAGGQHSMLMSPPNDMYGAERVPYGPQGVAVASAATTVRAALEGVHGYPDTFPGAPVVQTSFLWAGGSHPANVLSPGVETHGPPMHPSSSSLANALTPVPEGIRRRERERDQLGGLNSGNGAGQAGHSTTNVIMEAFTPRLEGSDAPRLSTAQETAARVPTATAQTTALMALPVRRAYRPIGQRLASAHMRAMGEQVSRRYSEAGVD